MFSLRSFFMLVPSGRNSLPRLPEVVVFLTSGLGCHMDGHLLVLVSSPPPNIFTSADDMKGRHPQGNAFVRGECSPRTQQQWLDLSRGSGIGWMCDKHSVKQMPLRFWNSFALLCLVQNFCCSNCNCCCNVQRRQKYKLLCTKMKLWIFV